MKWYVFILTFFLTIQIGYSLDKKKLDEIVNLYVTNITKYSQNQEKKDCLSNLTSIIFYSPFDSGHCNDLFEIDPDKSLLEYLGIISDNFNNSLEVTFTNVEILDCVKNFPETGETFAFGLLSKEIKYQNKKTSSELLVVVRVNSLPYKLERVLFRDIPVGDFSIESCAKPTNDDEKIIQFEIDLLKKADDYFSQMLYSKALDMYEDALLLNPKNTATQDKIQNCNALITLTTLKLDVEKLIVDKHFFEAKERLENLKKREDFFDPNWIDIQLAKILDGTELQEFERNVSMGDHFFQKHIYPKALDYYKKAALSKYATPNISTKIEACKNSDPNYVKNELNKAYKDAKSSKKNWINTFKTYLKFESSGLLTGDQYHFMCLMMLDNGRVKREMGYSGNQTYFLAKEYFYKAKEMGYDNSYYETQVFTSDIQKKQKK